MDMQAITDKYYELTNAICDVEVTIVGEDGVERRAAYGDLLVNGTVVMCGGTLYAYRNKWEYGPLDGWWDNIDDGHQANVYQVLYWYHRGRSRRRHFPYCSPAGGPRLTEAFQLNNG